MDIDDERASVVSAPSEQPTEIKKRKKKKVKKMPMVETPSMIMGTGSNDGLGGGGIGLIALLALLGGRGRGGLFGGDGDGGGAAVSLQNSIDTSTIMTALGNIQAAVPLAESQVQLALAGVSSDITSQSLQQTIALQNQGFQAQLAAQAGFNSVGDKVDNLAAANALAIATNQFNCVNATQVDGEKTRALITTINENNLNRIITVQAAELAELRNEGARASDRHGVEVTMINNQNQNQMQFQQQQQVLNTMAHVLADVSQVARATNSNVIVGNTGASTTGAQTASPTNVRA
jgi:hypothetical protein